MLELIHFSTFLLALSNSRGQLKLDTEQVEEKNMDELN